MGEGGLTIPETGIVRIPVNAGDRLPCGFAPESVFTEVQGADLSFTSESGGVLLLVGFVPALEEGEVTLVFSDFTISGRELHASLTTDFSTDAGGVAAAAAEAGAVPGPGFVESGLSISMLEAETQCISDLLHSGLHGADASLFDLAYANRESFPKYADDPFVISVAQISHDAVDDAVAPHLRRDLLL